MLYICMNDYMTICVDREISAIGGGDLGIHRQTSTSSEVEELKKALEVCIKEQSVAPLEKKKAEPVNPESGQFVSTD